MNPDFFEESIELSSAETTDTTSEAHAQTPSSYPNSATHPNHHLHFTTAALSSHLLKATIEVDNILVDLLRSQTIELFADGNFDGFEHNNIPHEYIEETYHNEITIKVKNYLFDHVVIDFVMNEITHRKINLANYPRLTSIEIDDDKKMIYHFDISIADPLELKEWKHFAFKSPKRKKYKDLDKQVISFIEKRATQSRKNNAHVIDETDWVLFDALMLNQNKVYFSPHLSNSFWFRIGQQEVTEPFVCQLIGKELNSCFITKHFGIQQNRTQKDDDRNYPTQVTIKALIKGSQFSLDLFKATFKLKNKADIHNKLMEVFSYRNDVSQRKAIIEEVFHLLLSKHRFEVPKHLVLRREEDILYALTQQPDYHVYKAQKDFESYVEMLAEKQLKEEIIIDQIAYNENIKADIKDSIYYIHLLCNKRLKEFIYFKPLLEKLDDLTTPISMSTLLQAVMREKTLNYIIYMLTK